MAMQQPNRVHVKALPPPAYIDQVPPPHDLDAEAAVLSAVILDPSQLEHIEVGSLQPAEFYAESHRQTWVAILFLRALAEKIDVVTIANRLKNTDRVKQVGGLPFLNDLLNAAPAVANASAYARSIKLLSRLRDLAAVAQRVSARCYVDRADPADVFAEAERLITDVVRAAPGFGAIRYDADAIFESPMSDEPDYICKALLLAPGRGALVAGSPDSGKTLAWQSVAVAIAGGVDVWSAFNVTRQGLVVHLNWDQELEATKRRYRKLLRGRGMSVDAVRGYLEVIDDPPFALDTDAGLIELHAICRTATLVIIDALTGALSETDEKDPAVGRVLRKIGKISEKTGCVVVIIHHAVKPPPMKGRGATERDAMHDVRGSGAIPGASGGVFVQSPIRKGELYSVKMARPPTIAKRSLENFGLRFEDVNDQGEDLITGKRKTSPSEDAVRIVYVSPEELGAIYKRDGKRQNDGTLAFEQFALIVLERVKTEPDLNTKGIHARFTKTGRPKLEAALEWLESKKLVAQRKGLHNATVWRAV